MSDSAAMEHEDLARPEREQLSPLGIEMIVAFRRYADAAGRWMRDQQGRLSGSTAGRTRGNVLVITAIGEAADRIEGTLLREDLLREVQLDYDEHMLRSVEPDYVRQTDAE